MVEGSLPPLFLIVVGLPLGELTRLRLRSKIDAAPFLASVELNPWIREGEVLSALPIALVLGSTRRTV
jgi:hypothetical protein